MSIDFESKLQQYLYSLISTSNTNLANTFDSFQLTLQQTISEAINRAIQEGLPLLADSVRKEYASLPTDPTLLAMASEISSMLKTAIAERDEALAAASAAKEQLAALTSSPQTTSVVPALKSAVFEIQKHATQAEILTSLVEQSANFAPRIVLFVVKSGNAVAWLAKGFDSNTIGDEAIRGKMLALNSDTILRKALSKQTTYYEPPLGHKDNKQIFELLSSPLPAVIAAIPLVVRGKAAAVLYADAPSENLDVDSLDILVDVAALTIELLSFRPKGSDVQLGHKPSPPGHTSQKTQGTLEENAIKSNQALAKSSEISSTESVVTAPAPSFPPASPTITTEPQKGFDFAASPAPTPPSFSFTPPPATEPPQKGF
ncbi:MAG: hypothetical protein RMM17_13870, partial [Acidobacteriota bacterium]|nr:hypothetical protein [Acidobacteriota bacterium]